MNEKKSRNFVVTGYFDRNFGDDMMIRILASEFPNDMFYLNLPRIDSYLSFETIPNIKPNPGLSIIKENLAGHLEVGGSIYNITKKVAFNRLREFLGKKRIYGCFSQGTKMVTMGCNINPIKDRRSALVLKYILNGSDLFTVRENYSIETAKKVAPNSNSYVFRDIVFSMPDSFMNPPAENKGCLGISVYRSYFSKERQRHYIPYCKKMIDVAEKYIEATDKDVLLLAFDTGNENDLHSAHYIKDNSKYPDRIHVVAHDDDGTKIIRAMQSCSVILGARFHSVVMSICLGVPFIPVAYSAKTDNMLEDLNYTGKTYRYESIASIPTEEIIEELKKAKVLPITDEIRENASGHIQMLKKVLGDL